MANNIKKIPFPDWLLKTDYSLSLNAEGISEEGEPISSVEKTGKCIFSEHSKRIIDSNGKQITLVGKAIMKGDIAPSLKTISDGTITINGRTYDIYSGARPRNPDGSIHSSQLELM